MTKRKIGGKIVDRIDPTVDLVAAAASRARQHAPQYERFWRQLEWTLKTWPKNRPLPSWVPVSIGQEHQVHNGGVEGAEDDDESMV